MRSRSVVTNVIDVNHVVLDWRRHPNPNSNIEFLGGSVPLDGIVAPEKESLEETLLRAILEKKLLGKKVNVVELLSGFKSHGTSIYVTDDPRRHVPEDNINLMLVREGYARFSGECRSGDRNLAGMAEAQRLAQAERKGIWADFEPPPDPPAAVTNAPPDPRPPTNVVTNAAPTKTSPVEPKPTPWKLPLIIGTLILGAVAVWRLLQKNLRKSKSSALSAC